MMLPQGVLPVHCLRDISDSARTDGCTPIKSFLSSSGCCHWHSGENALKRHGEGYSLEIPPLRATNFMKGLDFRGAPVGMTQTQKALQNQP